jgi:hypothetical protein
MRRGDMGEPMFDDSSIKAGGYDRPEIRDANVVPSAQFGAMLSTMMNPKGEQAVSAALQAAAARGDWDAVNRYYASKGQSFAGMAPPGGGMDSDLYKRAFGPGVKSTKSRERAADVLRQMMQNETQMAGAKLQAGASRYGADAVYNAAMDRNAAFREAQSGAATQRDEASVRAAREKRRAFFGSPEGAALKNKLPKDSPQYKALIALELKDLYDDLGLTEEDASALGFADGGPVLPPSQNPMGTFGQPPVMQSLDPAVREYGQYVHAATMNGLQPVPFGKFINLLASARQQMQTLPTTGGQYGFADGGPVEEPSLLSKLFGAAPAAQPPAPSQEMAGRGAALLGQGMAGQAAQAIQGRSAALEEALGAARGARMGYAGGGAIPVAGRQVLGPGGPRDDAIPAVIDGKQQAALSNGEFVMPTDVTQYWGTAKLQQMIDKARGQ